LALPVNEVGEILFGVTDHLPDLHEVQLALLPVAAQSFGARPEALGGLVFRDKGGH
jgi:hypothetical protein